MLNKILIVSTLLIGFALSQLDVNNVNINDVDSLKDSIPGLEGVNLTSQKEEYEKVFREKCKKNGGDDAFDNIINSREEVQACFEKYINASVISAELDLAKKDGSMDEVFAKYCNKRPEIMKCVTAVTDKVKLCLEDKEKDNLKIVLNITETIVNFACYKDGDRLAMFIAEGGVECLTERKDAIQECANKTFSSRIPKDISINNLPLFILGERECNDFSTFQECTVKELEKCKDNTPANIVEALFKFIKGVTPCKSFSTIQRTAASSGRQQRSDVNSDLNKVKRSQQMDFSLMKSFSGKCNKYAGPNAYRDLEVSISNLKGCLQTQIRSANACPRFRTEIRNCTNLVINKLRICLPPQESYIPNFAHGSLSSVLNYLCESEGKNMNRFLHTSGLQCLFLNDPASLNACLNGTKTRRTSDTDIVTKTELCEDLDKVKLCLSTYISNNCAQEVDFKDVTMGIMESLKAPCSGCSIFISNFILLASIIFVVKLF